MYIDSNIFIFAAQGQGELGKNCRKIISLVENGNIICASSYLVIDEVIWVLKKNIGRGKAVKIVKAMISLPIKWLEVDRRTIMQMVETFETSNLDPRVSLHISSMKIAGISTIVSEDGDFDPIGSVERMTAVDCLKRYWGSG
ncbi:MAG: type II toxin-antitoxin system VapC family toxin [Candidatus Thermoplasmatota archaeon]|nr:type II toxin-antitoxin system VapC family toxin [Candidatus Thermoplasmatota archaeon]